MLEYKNYIALTTIMRKETVRFLRIWPQTLFPSLITQTLYFTIFGKFVGSQINHIQGVSYMAFIVPGLVMMAIINSSYVNVAGSFFSSKFQRSVEEILVSPAPDWVILFGYVGAGALRGFIVGVLVFGVSLLFTHPIISHGWIVLLFMMITSIMFALGGFLNGILAKKFDDVSVFPTFVLTPLTYLGGVFYSIKSLPMVWQKVSFLNPIMYMVNGFRYGFYGLSDVNIWASFIVVVCFMIMLIYVNLYFLKRGVGLRS